VIFPIRLCAWQDAAAWATGYPLDAAGRSDVLMKKTRRKSFFWFFVMQALFKLNAFAYRPWFAAVTCFCATVGTRFDTCFNFHAVLQRLKLSSRPYAYCSSYL
jgi:hypothetical protein